MKAADEARELADQLRIKANQIFTEATITCRELEDCAKDGYTRLASGEVQVSTSGVSDPTYALVVAPDEAADELAAYLDFLRWALKGANGAGNISSKWHALGKRRQSALPPPVGQLKFDCANIHGCPDDKPAETGRDGKCYTCYRYFKRNGRDRRGKYDREVA